jgi:hypothetical protein
LSFTLLDSLSLSKKKFFRAPQWELQLAIRILMGFLALFFLAVFLFVGGGLFFVLRKIFPQQDPISLINKFLVYYYGVDLLIRYFFQTLPVTDVKVLLIQPIFKKTIIRGVSLRSIVSVFNFVPLIVLFPFCVVFSLEGGNPLSVWLWLFAVLCTSGINHFTTFLVNKSRGFAMILVFVLGVGISLEKVFNIELLYFFGQGFEAIYQNPTWALAPFSLFVFSWKMTERFLQKELYLDKGLEIKKERIIGSQLDFFDRWGIIGLFIKNDIRLIIRNVRARQVVLMASVFLFYGLIFFTQEIYLNQPVMMVFAGLFITGGFMLTYGQYVPAWDSEYYSLLMCQNLSYKKYLNSKLYLMMFSVLLSLLFSLPYLYFGTKVMLVILAGAVFNFGLGTFITLFSGAFNSSPIKLNIKAKAFENTQNFNFTQLLFTLPKLVLPLFVFYLPYRFMGLNAGLFGLVFSGFLGVALKNQLLNTIEKIYKQKKHETLSSFKKT